MRSPLPFELVESILSYLTPCLDFRFFEESDKIAQRNLIWFLSLRLVCKTFDEIVIGLFIAAIRRRDPEDDLEEDDPYDTPPPFEPTPPTPSMMARDSRLLDVLMEQWEHNGGDTIHSIKVAAGVVDMAVALFSADGIGFAEVQELTRSYRRVTLEVMVAYLPHSIFSIIGGRVREEDLASKAPDLDTAALMAAAYLGHMDHLNVLLEFNAEIDPELCEWDRLAAPLTAAALSGELDIIELLIEMGVNVNKKQGAELNSPLHFAAMGGHPELVQLLLDEGATPDSTNRSGQTPLHLAAAGGHANVAGVLLSSQRVYYHITSMDSHRCSPVGWAIRKKHDAVLKQLLKVLKCEDVNLDVKSDEDGADKLSAIEMAALLGQENMFRMLYRISKATLGDQLLFELFKRALEGGTPLQLSAI
ncbi:uncharacterized protein DSM5745_04419 [Aspergillus mulundensis]|uniref:Uncharacterized protein n=1 Tax=Aspergillus mulundensis TaxID=1810919 RepID=A0A3D8SCS5_9EURO|nr:hypothetical protein DSM5745_04419 [Aspergillus mulundensis]RDW84093.1 hypothetical protein DSM5745_04419 [Aspergillus mulundensis]